MTKIDFQKAYIQNRMRLCKILKDKKELTYSEIKKKLNISHTETGRLLKDLILNEEIKKSGEKYSLTNKLPYWPILTSKNTVHQNIKEFISNEKSICVIDPMTIYGLDKTDFEKKDLVEIERKLQEIFNKISEIKTLSSKRMKKMFNDFLIKEINKIEDKKIKEIFEKNKNNLYSLMSFYENKQFNLNEINYLIDKKYLKKEILFFIDLREKEKIDFYRMFNRIYKSWNKVWHTSMNIKVINNF